MGKQGMGISMGCTSGLTFGDMSGVGGCCPGSVSDSVSGVLIDSGVLENTDPPEACYQYEKLSNTTTRNMKRNH